MCVTVGYTFTDSAFNYAACGSGSPLTIQRARGRFFALTSRGSPSAAPPTGVAFSRAFSLLADHSSHTLQPFFALEDHMILMI